MMFTSGATRETKGVMHSNGSLQGSALAFAVGLGLGQDDVILDCSPLEQRSSYLAIMMKAFGLGPTGERRPPQLRTFLCSGAPIPPVPIERAAREMGLALSSQWGMTEALAATLVDPSRALEKIASCVGRAFKGIEILPADEDGHGMAIGKSGRMLVRGPCMFMGYFKRPNEGLYDAQGWFDSGDVAYADEKGYIPISGRTKEMLIRGGENIPVVGIENVLYKHPAISAVAVVGFSDRHLGESVCAFVTLTENAQFDLAGLQAYMEKYEVTCHYWPERAEVISQRCRAPPAAIFRNLC